jgi:periplasmic copper chaperone A
MHDMTMDGGIMRMSKLAALPVPARATISFAPGGKHLMIFGLAAGTKALPITLGFASGGRITVNAAVRAAGAEPAATPDPHAGHHG